MAGEDNCDRGHAECVCTEPDTHAYAYDLGWTTNDQGATCTEIDNCKSVSVWVCVIGKRPNRAISFLTRYSIIYYNHARDGQSNLSLHRIDVGGPIREDRLIVTQGLDATTCLALLRLAIGVLSN